MLDVGGDPIEIETVSPSSFLFHLAIRPQTDVDSSQKLPLSVSENPLGRARPYQTRARSRTDSDFQEIVILISPFFALSKRARL